ncbi:MAG: ABC transporter substrate-binding protein [Deltaproteobacteria bacterium]|nr:ABC transporter substrate-binding protein [Deltaproteobacteria bacterium]
MRVAVADIISNSYFPAIAAVELGFFKEQGYEAKIENLFPVTRAMEVLRDGGVDFVAGSAHATLAAFPDWKGGKLLVALAQRMYWFLVVRSDLKAKRGEIGVVKGLRIGAAPGPDVGLKQLLKAAGIDPEREKVQIGPIPGASGTGVSFGVSAARALEEGKLDAFWANGMGAEIAIRKGTGTLVLDVRRGDGPAEARGYTFPVLVATEKKIEEEPDAVAAGVKAVVKAQRVLKENPSRATEVGKKLFPPTEAGLIATLIERDIPFYDPAISAEAVESVNRFAQAVGLLSKPVPYDQVVATRFRDLWRA